MKLSIIIPYYNSWEYTEKLLERLIPQLTEETELIIVDDGCNETRLEKLVDWLLVTKRNVRERQPYVKIIHNTKNSGGASVPRNIGLDIAKGEYVTFIDSDDMISEDYIRTIIPRLKFDIIFISWRTPKKDIVFMLRPPKWNCAVWCRIYKREIIGDTRFDENLRIAEDWKFNENIKYETSYCIQKVIYYYNQGRKGSILNGGAE